MNITTVDVKKMKTDTLSVECVWKSQDVGPFVRPAFIQDAKKRKKDIQVGIVKDVMTKKGSFSELFVSDDRIQKFFDPKRTTNKYVF